MNFQVFAIGVNWIVILSDTGVGAGAVCSLIVEYGVHAIYILPAQKAAI